jgi:hypothetical protein
MKKIILSVAVLIAATGLFAQKKVSDVATFVSETIDQGKLKQGNPQPVKFVLKNISNEPIIIEQANPTCGCTMGDYTKEPIAPGKEGFITATYNAAGVGHFDKHLTVKLAGIDELKTITITGDVLSTDDYVKWEAENKPKAEVAEVKAPETPAAKPIAVKTSKVSKTTKTKTKSVKKTTTTPATVKTK